MVLRTTYGIGDKFLAVPPKRKEEKICEVIGVTVRRHLKTYGPAGSCETITSYTCRYFHCDAVEVCTIRERDIRKEGRQ